jgi:hypothetical protein
MPQTAVQTDQIMTRRIHARSKGYACHMKRCRMPVQTDVQTDKIMRRRIHALSKGYSCHMKRRRMPVQTDKIMRRRTHACHIM